MLQITVVAQLGRREARQPPGEEFDAGRANRCGGKQSNRRYPDDPIGRDYPRDPGDRPKGNCRRTKTTPANAALKRWPFALNRRMLGASKMS